jgi:hypothetical protein
MTTVCTGFSPSGEREYGRNFLETFHKFWPQEVKLQCYTEQHTDVPRGGLRSLWDCRGISDFLERHEDNLVARGRKVREGWRPKHVQKGYCYKFDAHKFCRQLFIPEVLAWSDADVVTFAPVPTDFVEGMLSDADLCYLGRVDTYSEIGFWAVRLNTKTRRFLEHLADMFRPGRPGPPEEPDVPEEVFKLTEWHSAFVFDHVRRLHERAGLKALNLARPTAGRGNVHVWFQTPLGRYTDHLKGDARKRAGRSLERRTA